MLGFTTSFPNLLKLILALVRLLALVFHQHMWLIIVVMYHRACSRHVLFGVRVLLLEVVVLDLLYHFSLLALSLFHFVLDVLELPLQLVYLLCPLPILPVITDGLSHC